MGEEYLAIENKLRGPKLDANKSHLYLITIIGYTRWISIAE